MSILAGLQDTTIQQTATMLINPNPKLEILFIMSFLVIWISQHMFIIFTYIQSCESR